MFILKFPVAEEYENCSGGKTGEDSPFALQRDLGNIIWLGTIGFVLIVLSLAHFWQLRMDEGQGKSEEVTSTPVLQIVPRPHEDD